MRTATARLPGHPDAACDMVAESILDEFLRRDPESRLRISVQGGRGAVFVSGDVLSQADFDVSALVKRVIGSLGITDELEPFVSLEQVAADRTSNFRLGAEQPVIATGYATFETDDLLPETTVAALRLARALHEQRERDPDLFWLGPDGEVTIIAHGAKPARAIINVEHGSEPLDTARQQIAERLREPLRDLEFQINPSGVREKRGLAACTGSSNRAVGPYGSLIPSVGAQIVGADPRSAEKVGAWLARQAARNLVKRGARACLIQILYLPGENRPSRITARDERGRDLSSEVPLESLALDRVMKEWWRPGLNFEAAQWTFVGSRGLPWEA